MSVKKNKAAAINLLAISCLALFFELALIRFMASTAQVVAYFNNFLILSAFLGLGVGSTLVVGRLDLFRVFPTVFVTVIGVMVILDSFGFSTGHDDEVLWLMSSGVQSRDLPASLAILLVFIANFIFFVPLGYKLGACLECFEQRLTAYSFDLLGSLCGVAAFALVSYWQTAPWFWFSLGALLVLFLYRGHGKTMEAALFLAVGIAFTFVPKQGVWSPYYKVTWHSHQEIAPESPDFIGYYIEVDKLRIQDALRFPGLESIDRLKPSLAEVAAWENYYRLPYHLRKPERVLVLGAGSGNDATVGLHYGAEHIDVVEIDPVIVSLGYWLHPHRPYQDPRVTTINDDARSYLRKSNAKYDLIVMNALDSHRQIGGLSTLRLESYMYTVEAFRDARRLLAPDGIFIVHLGSTRPWMGERLYWTLNAAFGTRPQLLNTAASPFDSIAFAYGPEKSLRANRFPELAQVIVPTQTEAHMLSVENSTVLSTDDWPHLYLAEPRLPRVYALVLGGILLFSLFIISGFGRRVKVIPYMDLFLLGAGFMLLETRSITAIALYFGSTWIVNAIAIGGILFLIYCGNLLTLKQSPSEKRSYLGLFAALLLGYFVRPDFILDYSFAGRVVLAALWFGLPVFFASLIFSSRFRNVRDTSTAFGANLLGVVVGGVLEYSSMIAGLNSLYLLAALLYLCSIKRWARCS